MSQNKLLASFDNKIELTLTIMIYYIWRMYMKFLQKGIIQLIAERQMKYELRKYCFGNVTLILPNNKKLKRKKLIRLRVSCILNVQSNLVQTIFKTGHIFKRSRKTPQYNKYSKQYQIFNQKICKKGFALEFYKKKDQIIYLTSYLHKSQEKLLTLKEKRQSAF